MGWNDARVETLKALWADGLSASQIAGRLGGITRNAVCGKAHRLGLPLRANTPGSKRQNGQRAKKRRAFRFPGTPKSPSQVADEAARAAQAKAEYAAIIAADESDIPPEQRQTLLVRKDDGKLYANESFHAGCCKWPLSQPAPNGFTAFCGAPRVAGLAYCPEHVRRAFRPMPMSTWLSPIPWVPKGMKCPTDKTQGMDAWEEMGDKAPLFRVKEKAKT